MRKLDLSRRDVRLGVTALSMLFLASCAHTPDYPLTDLDLYRSTSLAGIHAHPWGFEGRLLVAAERKVGHRRAIVRAWLAAREGAETLDAIDSEIDDQVHGIYWIGSPSVDDEWRNIRRAKESLRELERRKRVAEGSPK